MGRREITPQERVIQRKRARFVSRIAIVVTIILITAAIVLAVVRISDHSVQEREEVQVRLEDSVNTVMIRISYNNHGESDETTRKYVLEIAELILQQMEEKDTY